MCTNPITITKNYHFGSRSYTVPCGKCAECLSKKRSQIAALSQLQANASGSVHFLTLTYDNDHLPFAVSKTTPEGPSILSFERGLEPDWTKNHLHDYGNGLQVCQSLHREDVKLWLKLFRRRWSRLHPDKPLDFKYLIFGELGERSGRPHYHGLFYGLTNEQAEYLSSLWKYGYTMSVPAPGRSLSVAEIGKVSNYVSKYISKGTYSQYSHLLPYMEKPRRQSSINFGLTDDETIKKLAAFIMAATCTWELTSSLDCLPLVSSLCFLIAGRLSLLMARSTRFLNR